MIAKGTKPSVVKQCKLLGISRSGFYYQPLAVSAEELELMRLLDEGHMKYPFYGCRLSGHGHETSRKKVVRLMRKMGIVPIYPKKNTSKPNREHKVYPYLLRDMSIDRLWRSLKSEEAYLKAYDSVVEARQAINEWMRFYNANRKHPGLGDQTPDSVYFGGLGMPLAA